MTACAHARRDLRFASDTFDPLHMSQYRTLITPQPHQMYLLRIPRTLQTRLGRVKAPHRSPSILPRHLHHLQHQTLPMHKQTPQLRRKQPRMFPRTPQYLQDMSTPQLTPERNSLSLTPRRHITSIRHSTRIVSSRSSSDPSPRPSRSTSCA